MNKTLLVKNNPESYPYPSVIRCGGKKNLQLLESWTQCSDEKRQGGPTTLCSKEEVGSKSHPSGGEGPKRKRKILRWISAFSGVGERKMWGRE